MPSHTPEELQLRQQEQDEGLTPGSISEGGGGIGPEGEVLEEEGVTGADQLDEEITPSEAGSILTQTVEDLPELGDLAVGDTIMLKVNNISGDGVYELAVEPAEAPLPEDEFATGEGLPEDEGALGGAPVEAGRGDVLSALT